MHTIEQRGFTLIELMIVIAILGILLAIAIPAYQDYTIRTRISEGLNLATAVKAGVAEYRINSADGSWPINNTEAASPTSISSQEVANIQVQPDGIIVISYNALGNRINAGDTIILTATVAGNAAQWSCNQNKASIVPTAATGTVPLQFVPASCRP